MVKPEMPFFQYARGILWTLCLIPLFKGFNGERVELVAPEMMGRIMSLVMFAAIGLNPVSTALAGALIGLNAAILLICAGILMTVFTLSAAFSPAVRAGME